jgi:cysteinyl-tRNA synthetase
VRIINNIAEKKETISANDLDRVKTLFHDYLFDILGLVEEEGNNAEGKMDEVVNLLLTLRQEAKLRKDFATSDRIRDELMKMGFIIRDSRDGFEWELKKD